MALLNGARRLALQLGRSSAPGGQQRRGMADFYVPKPDTSMDHVFGDSNFRLPFNFQTPSMLKTFSLFAVSVLVFGGPIWIMISEEAKMQAFLEKLDTAKKEAASS